MARARILDQLAAALRGDPPPDADWTALVNLANQSLVTPALDPALAPPDIAPFLTEVRTRNRERNRRLQAQLADALAALNAAGVTPTLLKGAALGETDRLLSDLDLLVEPPEVERAVEALQAAGFGLASRYPGPDVHVVAELGRPEDVGYLDLHQRPPGPPAIAGTQGRRILAELPGGRAWRPDAATQILHLVLHDQFHDGDYWRGGFDVRHLLDLARLAPRLEPADWAWLREACGTPLVRAALDAQLFAASRLVNAAVPPSSPHARRTYRRWRRQHAWPALRVPLAALTVALEARMLLAHRRAIRPRGFAPRLDRVRRIATVASGKV